MEKLLKKIKYLFVVAFLLSIILITNYSLVFADLNDITNLDPKAPSTSDIYNADGSISSAIQGQKDYNDNKNDLNIGSEFKDVTTQQKNDIISQQKKQKSNAQEENLTGDAKLLKDFSDIRKMIKDMCNTNENLSGDDVFNSDAMINKIFSAMTSAISDFNSSPIYSALTGIGILILLINFSFSFYQNMPNIERKTTEQILRMIIQFIISILIIANIGRFLNLAIGVSQFLLNKAIVLKNGLSAGNSISAEDQITLAMIKAEGLDKTGILDQLLGAIKRVGLMLKLFIPWIICLFSKLGILFGIVKIAIETIVYAMFYPLAAGDCYENIKHSNFMKYTKHIFACLMQLAVIVLILYASNRLLINLVEDITSKLSGTKDSDKMFELLVLLTIIQLSRTVVVMSSTSVIAHKAFGE